MINTSFMNGNLRRWRNWGGKTFFFFFNLKVYVVHLSHGGLPDVKLAVRSELREKVWHLFVKHCAWRATYCCGINYILGLGPRLILSYFPVEKSINCEFFLKIWYTTLRGASALILRTTVKEKGAKRNKRQAFSLWRRFSRFSITYVSFAFDPKLNGSLWFSTGALCLEEHLWTYTSEYICVHTQCKLFTFLSVCDGNEFKTKHWMFETFVKVLLICCKCQCRDVWMQS